MYSHTGAVVRSFFPCLTLVPRKKRSEHAQFSVYLLYLHVHVCNMAVESATKDHCNAKKGLEMSHPDELIFLREQVRLLTDRVSLVEAFRDKVNDEPEEHHT